MALSPAMECRSLVEVLGTIAYINDNMNLYNSIDVPYGFVDNTGEYSSDGDVGSISSDSLVTVWATIPGTYTSDSYPYIIARGKAESGSFRFGVKDTGANEFWSSYISDNTFVTTSFTVPPGYTYASLALEGNSFSVDYIAIGSVPPITLTPHKIIVNRNISDEESTAELHTSTADVGNLDLLSSHIRIWLSKDTITSYNKVFSGKILRISKPLIGQKPRDVIIEATGYGQYLSYRTIRQGKHYEGLLHNIIRDLLSNIRDEGLLTTSGVDDVNEIHSKQIKSGMLVKDVIQELADESNCEYYVDLGGNFHWFRKGTRVSSLTLDTLETSEYPYEKDASQIINYQVVVGKEGVSTLKTSWSDSTSEWSSNGALNVDSYVKVVDTDEPMTSNYSIRSSLESSSSIWMELDVGTLDLSLGGVLNLWIQYKALVQSGESYSELKLKTYFGDNNGNTFTSDISIPGGYMSRRQLTRVELLPTDLEKPGYDVYYFPLKKVKIPFNLKAVESLNTIGTPSWDNITRIRFEIREPIPDTIGVLWLDNIYFDEIYYSATISDTVSINKYGKREGIPIGPDPSLDSKDKCNLIGSILVEAYKDPITVVEDVKTIRNFDFDLGYEYTLDVGSTSSTVILRNIRHELEQLNLTTYLTFSKQFIPAPDKLYAIMKKQLEAYGWNIEAWKRAKLPEGAPDRRSALQNIWETNEEFPYFTFTQARVLLALGESDAGWEIADSQYADLKVGQLVLETPPNEDSTVDIMYNTLRISDQIIENTLLTASAKIIITGDSINFCRYYIGDLTDGFGFYFDPITTGGSSLEVYGQTRVNGTVYSTLIGTIYTGDTTWFDIRYDKPAGTVYFGINKLYVGYLDSLPTTSSLAPIYVEVSSYDILGSHFATITFRGWELGLPWL